MMILESNSISKSPSKSLAESPPPYHPPRYNTPGSRSASSSSRDAPLPPLPPDVKGVQTVKQIFLSNRYQNISGTYCIDPSLPGQAHEIRPQKSKGPAPNSSFKTRHGKITLKLATAGRWADLSKKTNVEVRTNSGDINVGLFTAPSQRHIHLDVSSRQGDVVLLVPRSFSGVIEMRTKRGTLKFLPDFAKQMRVLKAKDDEALILIGENNFSKSSLHQDSGAADYCQLMSRSGTVTVGLEGENVHQSEPGLWTRLVQFFQARESEAI